jgi:hypothetical protein
MVEMRSKFVSVLAVFMVMLAGSAWADETSVVTAITEFGLARKADETGNTITIVNASENLLEKNVSSLTDYCLLDLGDITGITIDWKANLTVTGELLNIDPDDGFEVIKFSNGMFNLLLNCS